MQTWTFPYGDPFNWAMGPLTCSNLIMLLISRCCPMDLKNVETKLSGANANQGSFDMVIAAATFSWSPTAHLAIRRWTRRRLAPARAYHDEVRPGSRSVLSKPFPSPSPASSAWPAPTEIRQAYQLWNNWYLGPYISQAFFWPILGSRTES